MQVFVPLTSLEERRANCETTTGLVRSLAQVSFAFGSIKALCSKRVAFTPFSGAFGEVRMCVHRESGAQRAVKVLRKSHMDDDEKRMLFNEINILKEIVSVAASSSLNYVALP